MTDLATKPSLGLGRGAKPTRTGLVLAEDLTYKQWEKIGKAITDIGKASAWWIGDWLYYGDCEYGRKYEQALDITGLDYQTLRIYKMVAERFEDMSRRRNNLSLQHHLEVAALEPSEQDAWLDRAEAEAWSVHTMRDELRQARQDGQATTQDAATDTISPIRINLNIPPASEQQWRNAADRDGLALTDWITTTLDQAAA